MANQLISMSKVKGILRLLSAGVLPVTKYTEKLANKNA